MRTALPTSIETDLITQIFADMTTLMGSQYTNSNASVNTSLGATTSTMNIGDPHNNGYTITQRTAGPSVSVTPFGSSLGPGETQQFTAVVKDGQGVAMPAAEVSWTITQGGYGSVSPTGLYTAPAAVAQNAYDILTVTDVASGSSMGITVSLHP